MMKAISELVSGNAGAIDSIFNQIKSKKLNKDFKLRVPPRGHSQIRIDKLREPESKLRSDPKVRTKSLQQIADETGLKHGVMRLVIINFNHLFADRLSRGQGGQSIGTAPSYQHIYELMQMEPQMMQILANTQLPEGSEVKLVPSYGELYSYDRGFYLLTREESKAFQQQIMNEIERTVDAAPWTIASIGEMSLRDMINMSSLASEIERNLQVKPVDKILKTPIGYIDKLKEDRLFQFYQRMHFIQSTYGKKDQEPSDLIN